MRKETPRPEIGMGATMGFGSDRHAATVIEVRPFKSGARKGEARAVIVQQDTATVVSGSTQDGSASYEYSPDLNGRIREYTIRPNGKWVAKGESLRFGSRLGLGHRSEYYDPHF